VPSSNGSVFGNYPRALVESCLEKLLASAAFRRSERHRRFLRHLVQSTLDGHQDQLKEVLIGIVLFDRRVATYDPRTDPIVRVEAGRLREKLARYYQHDGAGDAFAFHIPVGSYVPRFERRSPTSRADREVESFAVMPFASSGLDEDVSFAIGLADQLISRLGRVPGLTVIARFSAFKARERQLEIKALGKLLKVTRIVDGSIQRQGTRMRCIAHVYRARDGVCLWSHSFDSNAAATNVNTKKAGADEVDLFAFQDQIVDTLLAAAAPVSADHVTDGRSHGTGASSVMADHRRKARDLLERASYLDRRYEVDSTEQVIALAEQAIVLDPDSARAHVVLATAYLHQTTLLKAPGLSVLPRLEAALDRAIELDPRDGDAIAMRAMIAFRFSFDWALSERLFHEALRISARTSSLNYRFAFCLILNGRFAEGLAHARIAVDLDPLNLGLRASSAQLSVFAREYDDAEAAALGILELEPRHLYMTSVMGLIHLYRGEFDAAFARFDHLVAWYPDHPIGPLGRVTTLGLRGDVDSARDALTAWLAFRGDAYCPPFSLAKAQVAAGDRTAAYATLERGLLDRDASICSLSIDPVFGTCRDDPAFTALLARIGLPTPI
jgi:serine/threonine-protein kinase